MIVGHPEDIAEYESHAFESIADSFDSVGEGVGFDIFIGFKFVLLFSFGFGVLVLQILIGFGLFFEVVLEEFDAVPVVFDGLDFLLLHVQHKLQ